MYLYQYALITILTFYNSINYPTTSLYSFNAIAFVVVLL